MDEPNVEQLAEENADSRVKLLTADCTVSDLAELLVAMANGDGGTLLLELGTATLEDAADRVNQAALRIEPIPVLPLPVALDQGVLLVTVPEGLPHVFALDGRYLTRDGNKTRALNPMLYWYNVVASSNAITPGLQPMLACYCSALTRNVTFGERLSRRPALLARR